MGTVLTIIVAVWYCSITISSSGIHCVCVSCVLCTQGWISLVFSVFITYAGCLLYTSLHMWWLWVCRGDGWEGLVGGGGYGLESVISLSLSHSHTHTHTHTHSLAVCWCSLWSGSLCQSVSGCVLMQCVNRVTLSECVWLWADAVCEQGHCVRVCLAVCWCSVWLLWILQKPGPGEHPLQYNYSIWFSRRSPKNTTYDQSLKFISSFASVRPSLFSSLLIM